MSARFIAKEDVNTCERWQFGGIGESAVRYETTEVRLPTAAEVQELQDQAIREGYASGLAEVQAQASAFASLAQALADSRTQLEDALSEEVLALALKVASQVLRTSLKVKPELVLPVVREAIRLLPSAQGDATIAINPLHAELVETHLAEELKSGAWRVVADESVAPGGCRIETASGAVDATLKTRWERVIATLGAKHEWIE